MGFFVLDHNVHNSSPTLHKIVTQQAVACPWHVLKSKVATNALLKLQKFQ